MKEWEELTSQEQEALIEFVQAFAKIFDVIIDQAVVLIQEFAKVLEKEVNE
jgi:hypothetical protein